MPISVNNKEIVAINCEGREIVRAHDGLDLVWEKQTGYEGFVNINGTWWSDRDISVDIGSGKCFVLNPFSVDLAIGYYDINLANVDLILSNFPGCRFPNRADVESLFTYILKTTGRVSSAILPDLTFWREIFPYNVNSFGLNFVGNGYSSASGRLSRVLDTSYLCSIESDGSGFLWSLKSYYYTISGSALTGNYIPVRLILNV